MNGDGSGHRRRALAGGRGGRRGSAGKLGPYRGARDLPALVRRQLRSGADELAHRAAHPLLQSAARLLLTVERDLELRFPERSWLHPRWLRRRQGLAIRQGHGQRFHRTAIYNLSLRRAGSALADFRGPEFTVLERLDRKQRRARGQGGDRGDFSKKEE